MTDFVSNFTRMVVGLGHDTEDGNPTPVVYRTPTNPLRGSGLPQPPGGQGQPATSPYVENNPLPL